MSSGGWIDAHCHLSDPRIFDRAAEILGECKRVGVGRFFLGGVDESDWKRQRDLDSKFPGRFFKAFGLHPWWVHGLGAAPDRGFSPLDAALERLRAELPDAHALGETGLDAARGRMKDGGELQLRAFRAQLAMALEIGKPLVLHVVRAHSQALQVLEESAGLGGMVHSFSGNAADAERYLRMGLLLSISARIVHPDADELRAIVRDAPADQLVLETDAPDQAPWGSDQKLHFPVTLIRVAEAVAKVRGGDSAQWLDSSRDNLRRVFLL